MGLFDIFRRHKKKPAEKTEQTANTESSAVASSTAAQETNPASSSAASEGVEAVKSATAAETSAAPAESSAQTEPGSSAADISAEDKQPAASATDTSTSPEQPAASEQPAVSEISEKASASEPELEQPTSPSQEPADSEKSASTAQATEPASQESTAPADQASEKYDKGLAKSRTGFGARLNRFLANFRHVDEDFFDDLEDMLIESDVGYDMAMKLSDELREEVKLQNAKSKQDVSNVIIEKMVDLYEEAGKGENPNLNMAKEGPTVIMFVGVNGAGKTTTIGKMAALFKKQGKKVLLAAADTFRAGATEQLDVWAKRDGVDIVTGPENGDPAAVVFDAVQKAKKEDYDILFVDTAGRLQNKVNLMKELAKMKRILTREIPDAPHEVLLVLDATTGQNALNQAKLFKESTDVTGIVLTKLDGTARGGIVLAIRNELHLPVKYVGLGEKVDDLQKFDASDFVYGLFKGLVEVD
jgi:fused signal recognition particle receptor